MKKEVKNLILKSNEKELEQIINCAKKELESIQKLNDELFELFDIRLKGEK